MTSVPVWLAAVPLACGTSNEQNGSAVTSANACQAVAIGGAG